MRKMLALAMLMAASMGPGSDVVHLPPLPGQGRAPSRDVPPSLIRRKPKRSKAERRLARASNTRAARRAERRMRARGVQR